MTLKINKLMKTYNHHIIPSALAFALSLLIISGCISVTEDPPNWKYKTSGSIQSHPVADDGVVYFGSNDSNFYAINANTGAELWKLKTGHKVRSSAHVSEGIVYFASGNDLFAHDKKTGREIWAFNSFVDKGAQVIDPWDYHTGSPVRFNDNIYVGFGNGLLLGLNNETGQETFRYMAIDSAAIRSTPAIKNDVIYFGDWSGRVYALSIKTQDTLWTYKTYGTQPYPTFGQVNTRFAIKDTMLVFGGRNPELHALSTTTGRKVWSYADEAGGWISGDPVIDGSVVYVGGSDNHEMIALDLFTGEIIWQFKFLFNNFSAPVFHDKYLLFTTGDAYASMGGSDGHGYLYVLNKKNGELINMIYFEGNQFNTPAMHKQQVITGGDDGVLRTLELNGLIKTDEEFPFGGTGPVELLSGQQDSITGHLSITYTIASEDHLHIMISEMNGQLVNTLFDNEQVMGENKITWTGVDDKGNVAPDGYYFMEFRSGVYIRNVIFQHVNK
jgi:outer membrane protein assembly factor BamB